MGQKYICSVILFAALVYCSATASSYSCSHKWLTAYKDVRTHVTQAYPECSSSTDIIVESNSDLAFALSVICPAQTMISSLQDTGASSACFSNVDNAIVITELNASPLNDSRLFEFKRRYNSRFQQPCTIVLYEMDSILLRLNNSSAPPETGEWPDSIAVLTPSRMDRAFFVFYTLAPKPLEQIQAFTNFTSMILHFAVIIPSIETEQLVIYRTFPHKLNNLIPFQTYSCENKKLVGTGGWGGDLLFPQVVDFHGEPLLVITAVQSSPDQKLLESHGIMGWMFGGLFETLKRFNATMEVEEVFGIPGNGFTEEGSLDDFTLPLVDHSAVFSTCAMMSDEISRFVHVTAPYGHQGVYFLTGLPKRLRLNSLAAFSAPLDEIVWLGVIMAAVSILASLRFIVHMRKYKFSTTALAAAVARPIVDQQALPSHSKIELVKDDDCFKLVVATWFLSQIVLVCVYKSILTYVTLIPRYKMPPRTFPELASSEEYEIGAIFYENALEDYLKAANNSISRILLKRITGYEYIDPYCYTMVLDRPAACLGYSAALDRIGGQFTRDIRGRPLTMKSRDSRYETLATVGVAKFYPIFTYPLSWYIELWSMADLNVFHWADAERMNKKQGREFAEDAVKKRPVYKGVDYQEDDWSEAKRMVYLLREPFIGLLCVAMGIFLMEISENTLTKVWFPAFQRWWVTEIDLPPKLTERAVTTAQENMSPFMEPSGYC